MSLDGFEQIASRISVLRINDEHSPQKSIHLEAVLELSPHGLLFAHAFDGFELLSHGGKLDCSFFKIHIGQCHVFWKSTYDSFNHSEVSSIVVSGKQDVACDHFGEHASDRPDVDLGVPVHAENDFGCSVLSRLHELIGDIVKGDRATHVDETNALFWMRDVLDENVFRLDVCVNITGRVHRVECLENLFRVEEGE